MFDHPHFPSQSLHVSGVFVAHHQDVYCIYTIGTCCICAYIYLYIYIHSILPDEGPQICPEHIEVNPLTPNDPYRGRIAPLTSKRCILYIYSTNIGIEYFKHGKYSPFFFLFKMQFVSLF